MYDTNTQSVPRNENNLSKSGMVILISQPTSLVACLLGLMLVFTMVAGLWSYFGRADVIVMSPGTYQPVSNIKKIYTPIEGEIINVLVQEGSSVNAGDALVRIDASSAITTISQAKEANIQLEKAKRKYQEYPQRRIILEQKFHSLKNKLARQRTQYSALESDGLDKIARQHKLKIKKAQIRFTGLEQQLEHAIIEVKKYQRLYRLDGGGGISGQTLDEKRQAMDSAKNELRLAEATFNELELSFSSEYAAQRSRIDESHYLLSQLELDVSLAKQEIKDSENEVKQVLESAEIAAKTANRISPENLDEEQFLIIRAPNSGLVTFVAHQQKGARVTVNTAIIGIVPLATKNILQLEIPESQRGLLEEGQVVHVKFNAFPFQQHGSIQGKLAYISPDTSKAVEGGSSSIYKASVNLEREHFLVDGVRRPLRYGMTAIAQIVVRERRLIDIALDPFRKLHVSTAHVRDRI